MKILSIFRIFSKKDWHWMQKFVESPVFNQHEPVQQLFRFLRKQDLSNDKSYSSDFLHKKAFKNSSFDTAKIHHTTHYLLQTTENYLAWDEWWRDEAGKGRYLLQALRHRGLSRQFEEQLHKVGQKVENQPLRHAEHYRFRYELALEAYQHALHETGRSTPEQLQEFTNWHDISFLAEKLKFACGIFSHQRFMQQKIENDLLPMILAYVESKPALLQYPAIAVYYHGYQALSHPGEDRHFFALKKWLADAAGQFPLPELRAVYLIGVNFCINRINLRQEQFLREIFELYRSGLESEVFLENGQITRLTYTNIAFAAMRLREFDWVLQFLNSYREHLPEVQRQGTYSFNLARFYCEKGDYRQAMALLLEMDFDDVSHNLTAKAMLAKMYWETGEIVALDSLLASFAAYLRRKRQVSEQQRQAYRNFVHFLKKSIALPPGDKAKKARLREEIKASALVAEKEWMVRIHE
ncbi:MAG TPA: hypothetical protein VK168_11330 [Saprospiraceae bacterium]|nr:hypothetical protein [Saprospiraceae bacterium]